jgi:SagB-type dehydrogenase family enzyme
MTATAAARTHCVGILLWFLMGGTGMCDGTSRLIKLPAPARAGQVSLEETLTRRRSLREFSDAPIMLADIAQLCWAAQGVTDAGDHRSAPSAGALYPLDLYVAVGRVDGLEPGIYHYDPHAHTLEQRVDTDRRRGLYRAALEQEWVQDAPLVFVITAVYQRTTRKYRNRGVRYAHIEAGHAAQNLLLQATALGLAGVPVGAFDDDDIQNALEASPNETPLYLLPVGRP